MCRNCDNLIVSIVKKQKFGSESLQLSLYCSYWYNKNFQGYANSLYNVRLDDAACTQFLSHENVLDLHGINVPDLDYLSVSPEDISKFPILSFLDKGYYFRKIDSEYYLTTEKGTSIWSEDK